MAVRPLTIRTIGTAAASQALPELIQQIAREKARIVVEENGEPVAAIISPQDLSRLSQLDEREDAWQVIDRIRAKNRDRDSAEIEREVAATVTQVRRQRRINRERDKTR